MKHVQCGVTTPAVGPPVMDSKHAETVWATLIVDGAKIRVLAKTNTQETQLRLNSENAVKDGSTTMVGLVSNAQHQEVLHAH